MSIVTPFIKNLAESESPFKVFDISNRNKRDTINDEFANEKLVTRKSIRLKTITKKETNKQVSEPEEFTAVLEDSGSGKEKSTTTEAIFKVQPTKHSSEPMVQNSDYEPKKYGKTRTKDKIQSANKEIRNRSSVPEIQLIVVTQGSESTNEFVSDKQDTDTTVAELELVVPAPFVLETSETRVAKTLEDLTQSSDHNTNTKDNKVQMTDEMMSTFRYFYTFLYQIGIIVLHACIRCLYVCIMYHASVIVYVLFTSYCNSV